MHSSSPIVGHIFLRLLHQEYRPCSHLDWACRWRSVPMFPAASAPGHPAANDQVYINWVIFFNGFHEVKLHHKILKAPRMLAAAAERIQPNANKVNAACSWTVPSCDADSGETSAVLCLTKYQNTSTKQNLAHHGVRHSYKTDIASKFDSLDLEWRGTL